MPGLVQSPDYIRALMLSGDGVWWESSSGVAEERISFRLEQQRRVLDADEPEQLTFLTTETTSDQVIGDVATMRGQVLHLLQLSERENLSVRTLRRDVSNNPIPGGDLITLDFGDTAPRIAFSSAVYGPSATTTRKRTLVPRSVRSTGYGSWHCRPESRPTFSWRS